MATITDVCNLAQVSKATVSRILNGNKKVSEETKKRVLQAIKELNYKPNLAAQTLATKRSNGIGMLVGVLSGSYYSSLMCAVEEVARDNKYHLIVTSGRDSNSYETEAITFLQSKLVDGLIIHAGSLSDNEIIAISKEVPATVLINHYIPEIADKCTCLDDELGGYLATKHLLDNGHTHIGCITGPLGFKVSRDRLQGYRNALSEYGIQYDPNLIVEGRFDLEEGNVIAPQKLLDRNTALTAIFCLNDHIALGVYEELKKRKISVGEQISVIGFDNSVLSCHVEPKLTSVNFPISDMGVEATNKVLSLINKTNYSMKRMFLPELVIRNSVKKLN
ncbi:MAG: LacI family transcriptional regulator [Psychromonas sp.]|jgi:LacI family transcriptional regulator|uniref:LacI family DNA-binding transcriptional regulator n=1 Tax=Psychromonas sp. TaxID=1884585 RepID=UPI0039E64F85